MFVQSIDRKKKKKKKRKECSSQEIDVVLFFLSCRHTIDIKIVLGNEEKSCGRPIAPTYLANERCQRPTERERETSTKKMTEKQQQQPILSLVDRYIKKTITKRHISTS